MATEANTAAATPKIKTVGDDMPSRRIFANIEEAGNYLATQYEAIPELADGTVPMVAPGYTVDEDGNGSFDSAVYTGPVMVAVLRNARKVKAIVVAPIPSIDDLLANEASRAWTEKVLHKELNHVAVRHLRDAEDVVSMADQVPTTLEGYITSGRDGTGGIMETYDELYKLIIQTLGKRLPVWEKARFTKGELKKALESKGYASEYYPAVEDYKGQSLFVTALELGTNAAKRKGLDPSIFDRWASTRDQKAFNPADTEDEDDNLLDSDSLLSAMMDEEAAAPAPAETTEEPATEAATA